MYCQQWTRGQKSGCGCRVAGEDDGPNGALLALALALPLLRRRRRAA